MSKVHRQPFSESDYDVMAKTLAGVAKNSLDPKYKHRLEVLARRATELHDELAAVRLAKAAARQRAADDDAERPRLLREAADKARAALLAQRSIWALRHADGTWRAPDHFVSSRTSNPQSAKPFFGDAGKYDASLFQKLSPGSEVLPHPHPEVWS